MIFKSGGQEAQLALISTERHGNGAGVDNGAPPPLRPVFRLAVACGVPRPVSLLLLIADSVTGGGRLPSTCHS